VKIQSWVSAVLLAISAPAFAGLFTSDGNTFEECMENRIDEIKTPNQHVIAAEYCRQKHPAPLDLSTAKLVSPPDPVELKLVQGTELNNAIARPEIAAISVRQIAVAHDGTAFQSGLRTPDFKWYSRVDVTNRNRFPLSAIIVGLPVKEVSKCDWDEKAYSDIYQCDGYANAGMSGSFRCDIPDVERRHYQLCIIGLGIEGTNADLTRYLGPK
jgi:hypothetical protein